MGLKKFVTKITQCIKVSKVNANCDMLADTVPEIEEIKTFLSRQCPNVTLQCIGSGKRERWQVQYWTEIDGKVISFQSQTARSLHQGIAFYQYQVAKM